MSRLPYARNLAARGVRAEQFPDLPAQAEVPGRPSYRRRMLIVVAAPSVWLAEAITLTVNAAWWHFSPPWLLPAVILGNAAACGVFVLSMRRR